MSCSICGGPTFGPVCQYCKGEKTRTLMIETQVLGVSVPGWGMVRHLKVRRSDGRSGITWDQLQLAKNDALGPEVMAIEVYPPQDELVDEEHIRHLWEVPPGVVVPNLSRR